MCFYKIYVLLLSNNKIKLLLDLHFLLKNKNNSELIIFIVDNYIFSNCFIVFLLELIDKPINMKLSACTIFILLYNIYIVVQYLYGCIIFILLYNIYIVV